MGITALTLLMALAAGRAHPMHTAVAEVVQEPGAGATSVQIRLFADDLRSALPPPRDSSTADSALARYLRGTFALTDRTGRPVPMRWLGMELAGDVVVVRLKADVPAELAGAGLAGARITSLMLCERFPDQVNIVRASYGGHATTLLFLKGEGSKRLP